MRVTGSSSKKVLEAAARYVVVGYGASGGHMKFFIDTADVKEIREASAMGLVDGVTTNPSLVAKSGRKFRDVLLEICDIVKGPVSAEVTAVKHDEMVKEGRELAALRPNIVVKVPLIPEGLKAIRTLNDEGIKINCTLCFSPTQA